MPLGEGVSPYLASIALRCLAKAPQDRPESAALLLGELGRQTESMPIPDVRAATLPSPTALVGREAEMARFRSLADDVSEGRGRTVLVLGEPGIGKTALATEVGREIRAREFRWIEARLSPLEGLRRPLLHSLRRCLEREAEASSGAGGSTGAPAPGSVGLSSSTAEILERLRSAEDSDSREKILGSTWEIERMLTTLSRERPLAVLVEDVHTCDHDEIRTLAGLSASLDASRVLLVLTWRTKDPDASDGSDGMPSGYYDLIALRDLVRLELAPLPEPAVRALVEETAGVPFVAAEVLDRIVEAAEGIPLYALSLFRHLTAAGEIETVEECVQPTALWGRTTPPRFIREMVTQRLERLGEEERLLLETASVAGTEFDGSTLAGLVGMPLLTVLRWLQRLYRDRALVEPLERGYRFAHALYRDAIYADLAPDLRRALHRAYAEALEASPRIAEADPEPLGWHWEQAGEAERATPPLREAARRAVRRGELDRAWDLAGRSGVFDPKATSERLRGDLDLLLSLGTRLGSDDRVASLQALHRRLFAAAEELQDAEMRRRTLVAASWDLWIRRGAEEIDAHGLEEAAGEIRHPIARLEAFWLLANLARDRADLDAARTLLAKAEAVLEEGQRPDLRQSILHTRALMLRAEGALEEALADFVQAADGRERDGGSVHAAISRCMALMTKVELGDLSAAAEMEAPIRALERGRQRSRAALAMVFQSNLLQAAGDAKAADAALRRAEPLLIHGRFQSALGSLLELRLRREVLRGALEEARATRSSLRDLLGADAVENDPTLSTTEALLHWIEGEGEAAKRRALDALAAVRGRAHRRQRGSVLLDLAELALLGLALPGLDEDASASASGEGVPVFLALSLDVLRGARHPADAALLQAGAAAAGDPRVGHRQAEVAVLGTILRARAHLLAEEEEEASHLLAEAQEQARKLEHLWLELHAFGMARAAGLSCTEPAARSFERILRERNPQNPERVVPYVDRWLQGRAAD